MIPVLYVDDEGDIREIVEMSLMLDPELEVRTCSSGPEALAIVESWVPRLILLDFMMPGMDGPATLDRLRAKPEVAAVPVVFVTARTAEKDVQALIARGAAGVLAKPFDPMTLAVTCRQFLL